ncbi:MAG: hypothetical protein RBS39_05675 [Phycisphaerales bacterium]|jgi:ferredoxin--NADP+ reductase|nr:hypothetical protein [Phycisphaerales bacterium]
MTTLDPESSARAAHGTSPGEPVLPDVRMHLHRPDDPGIATVVRTERCTSPKSGAFVRHVVLDVSRTRLAGAFRVGQSFGVLPPGLDENAKPHKLRLYSIASPSAGEDGQGMHLATTVKRSIDEHWETHRLFLGVASNYLCDLHEGDEVRVTGPQGKRFLLPADPAAHDYLFIATGTGIAPFRGMLMELEALGVPSRRVLVMGSPYETDLVYDPMLREMASRTPQFDYLTALSRQPHPSGERAMYVQDRLLAARDRIAPLLASERTLVYICGIAGMELGVLRAIAEMLPGDAAQGLVRIDPAVRADPGSWDRRMIHKQVAPTRRIMMEVY